jgi:glycosyltransferase involved in cell wall biosynthesis
MVTRRSEQNRNSGQARFLQDRDILVISLSDWEGPKRIRQFLSEELARQSNRVLFVESQYTLSKFLKKPDFGRAFRFLHGPRRQSDNLFLLATFPFIPGGEFSPLISKINWALQRTLIKRAMRRLGFRNPILWIFAYNASTLIGTLGESFSLYFCNDAFSLLVSSPALQKRVEALERSVIERSDIVFTVSGKLTEEKSRYHASVHTVTHGVDDRLFLNIPAQPNRATPSDLPGSSPLIGYSGVIRYMLDLDLIRVLAEQKPEWNFVLVGPIAESSPEFYARVEELKKRPNIRFLGPKRPEDLPSYISAFDVCLLPYVRTEVSTYYAAPLKFYEYLAAGKPVVSTVGPKEYDSDIVINCSSAHEVVKAINKALSKGSTRLSAKRKRIASQNSWSKRILQIDRILAAEAKISPASSKSQSFKMKRV